MKSLIYKVVALIAYVAHTVQGQIIVAGNVTIEMEHPSMRPSAEPLTSHMPSAIPTDDPTSVPSSLPSKDPTDAPSTAPSENPSTSRSNFPSVFPTRAASDAPSEPPSIPPSTNPSLAPSREPSFTPSDAPSNVPSVAPTAAPSIPPSDSPSGAPSRFPSGIPTASPSILPTGNPTTEPSNAPTDVFSEVPSYVPSSPPSRLPTMAPSISLAPSSAPSKAPSPRPSSTPSDIPSSIPTEAPSLKPSSTPSAAPTISRAPSSLPSTMPSLRPTLLPSIFPSEIPSMAPSTVPTVRPSIEPSSTPSFNPTLACHDETSYRSPLNDFECHDHQGTDCIQWRFLGLEIDQVIELVQNCPVSCNIDCGSLQPFEVTLSFGVLQVPSFLAPSAVSTLESVSLEYMTNNIQGKEPDSRFFIHDVELLSQNIIGRRRLRSSFRRELASTNLVVKVTYRGYAINLNSDIVEAHIIDGIESPGFVRSLQRSGNPALADVRISSTVDPPAIDRAPAPEDSESRRGGVAASVVISILFVFGVTAAYFHWQQQQHLREESQKSLPVLETGSDVVSPAVSVRSSIAQVLSFESILRMVSSPRSGDESTTLAGGSSSQSDLDMARKVKISPASSSESEVEEHPLTGIIPPMIVFDNIEDTLDIGEKAEDWHPRVKNVVPSRRMEASPDFLEKLRLGTGQIDESLVMYFPELEEHASISANESDEFFSATSSRSSDSSGLDFDFDDDDDDDVASISSAPVEISIAENVSKELKDATEKGELRRVISESDTGLPPSMPLPKRKFLGRGLRRPSWVSSDGTPSPAHSPGRHLDLTLNEAEVDERATIAEPLDTKSVDTHNGSGFMNTIFSMSPARKMRKVLSSSTDGSPKSTSSGTPKRGMLKRSNSRESDSSTEHKKTLFNNEKGRTLVFQIPRHGKLGLNILCDAKSAPKVQKVKDYSPLLGKAMPKDRLVSIDGVGTMGATLSDVTSLLGRKSGSRWTHASQTLNIVFWRPDEDDEDEDSPTDSDAEVPPAPPPGMSEEEEHAGLSFDSHQQQQQHQQPNESLQTHARSFDSSGKLHMPSFDGIATRRASADLPQRSASSEGLALRRDASVQDSSLDRDEEEDTRCFY